MTTCSVNSLQDTLRKLDNAISLSGRYLDNFERRMDEVRECLSHANSDSLKWEYSYQLFSGYSLLNSDSTVYYLSMMRDYSYDFPDLQLLTKVCQSEMYSLTGDELRFNSKSPLLMEGDIPQSIETRYFLIVFDSYSNFPFQNSSRDIELLDRAIEVKSIPATLQLYYMGLREVAYNNNQEALEYLFKSYDTSSDPYLKACVASTISGVYREWDIREQEEDWLCKASIMAIQTPSNILPALYNLAMMLFEDGDLERASSYSRFVLSRAVDGQMAGNVINSVQSQLSIMDSLEAKERSRSRSLVLTIVILLLAALVTTYLWRRSNRDRKAVSLSEADLKKAHARLLEADKIKEGVMFRYMLLSEKYLEESDNQRRIYHKVLKEEGEDKLKKILRDPTQTTMNYKEFYVFFDEAFLGIYPDFIQKVNTLFPRESQFSEGNRLNTQLRILAAIKLGLTDSGQIADFLNCSPSSVYTHRSRMKNHSICESDQFEDIIKKI